MRSRCGRTEMEVEGGARYPAEGNRCSGREIRNWSGTSASAIRDVNETNGCGHEIWGAGVSDTLCVRIR